ncbi:unnamed protein product [Effrenium voratum]|nr:unnamed protein product [Effrenium voratum]
MDEADASAPVRQAREAWQAEMQALERAAAQLRARQGADSEPREGRASSGYGKFCGGAGTSD